MKNNSWIKLELSRNESRSCVFLRFECEWVCVFHSLIVAYGTWICSKSHFEIQIKFANFEPRCGNDRCILDFCGVCSNRKSNFWAELVSNSTLHLILTNSYVKKNQQENWKMCERKERHLSICRKSHWTDHFHLKLSYCDGGEFLGTKSTSMCAELAASSGKKVAAQPCAHDTMKLMDSALRVHGEKNNDWN